MIIYLSSMLTDPFDTFINIFPEKKLNILVSYGLPQKKTHYKNNRQKINRLMLDSGTYTLYNQGKDRVGDVIDPRTRKDAKKHLKIDKYEGYLKLFGKPYDHVINFDQNYTNTSQAFDDNLRNLLILKKNNKNIVPVIHHFAGEELEYYLRKEHELIGVGSAHGYYNAADENEIFQRTFNARKKLHYFGWSKYDLASYPIYSCDSTTWKMEAIYGKIKFWDEEKKDEDKTQTVFIGRNEKRNTSENKEKKEKLKTYLKDKIGMNLNDLVNQDGDLHPTHCQVVNMFFFTEIEKIMTEKQKKLFLQNGSEYFD